MEGNGLLRPVKIGGFDKGDVLLFIDQLNSKICQLEDELKEARNNEGNPEMQQIAIDDSQLRALEDRLAEQQQDFAKEKEFLINQNQQFAADKEQLVAERLSIVSERDQLLSEKKRLEIEVGQLQAFAQAAASGGNADSAAIALKDKEISDRDMEIIKLNGQISQQNERISALNDTIEEQKEKIDELNEKLESSGESSAFQTNTFDIGSVFIEAKNTADRIIQEARSAADKVTRESKAQAQQIVDDANEKAAKTTDDANRKAAETLEDANTRAKDTLETANRKAENTIDEANFKASSTINSANKKAIETIEHANKKAAVTIDDANFLATTTINEANEKAAHTLNDANKQAKETIEDANQKAENVKNLSISIRERIKSELDMLSENVSTMTGKINSFANSAQDTLKSTKSLIDEADMSVGENGNFESFISEIPSYDTSELKIQDVVSFEKLEVPAPTEIPEAEPIASLDETAELSSDDSDADDAKKEAPENEIDEIIPEDESESEIEDILPEAPEKPSFAFSDELAAFANEAEKSDGNFDWANED